eukprot:TCONS_00007093-protein
MMGDPPPPSYDAVVSGTWQGGSQPPPEGSNPPYPYIPSANPDLPNPSEYPQPPTTALYPSAPIYPPEESSSISPTTHLPPKDASWTRSRTLSDTDITSSRSSIPPSGLTTEAPPDYGLVSNRLRSNSLDSMRSMILQLSTIPPRPRSMGEVSLELESSRRSSVVTNATYQGANSRRASLATIGASMLVLNTVNATGKEKREKFQKYFFLWCFLSFLPGAMIVRGFLDKDCLFDPNISYFLMTSGGVTMLAFAAICLYIFLDEVNENSSAKFFMYLGVFLWACVFGVQVWGSTFIFNHWTEWKDDLHNFPCDVDNFKLAFSLLVIFWILFGLSLKCFKND